MQKNNDELKTLCLDLMKADDQKTVIKLLKDAGYWENDSYWRYYGDRSSNINTINNQQSRSDAAIVEKLVNSVDARLINECLLKGIDPEGDTAPKSIREAVAIFFDNGAESSNAGLVREWPSTKRTEIARGITLASTGNKPRAGNPCFSIADSGEGQTPINLPNTILSLDKDNKIKIPFVQGKFNMGGTGVLEFCGENNLQLVVSRRNPLLVKNHTEPINNQWGFTIVRREDPVGRRRSSVYTYLAPLSADSSPRKGEILSFESATMPIFPEGKNAYGREAEWGTLLKLYEYSTVGFSGTNILLDSGLLRQLDLLLTDLALPIRLYECRDYSGKKGSFETNLTGIGVRLDDDKNENLEQEPESISMNVLGEKMTANIFVFKKGKAKTYRSDEGVIFSVNGQTHGYLSRSFFRRRNVGMSYIADSILVTINCSDISHRSREKLFMPSRDRLRNSELKQAIEKELEDLIGKNPGLREIKNRRRQEDIQSILNDQKPLEDILENLIKDSPTLAALFLQGKRLANPFNTTKGKDDEKKEFKGKRFPSFFKFEGLEYGQTLSRSCHINKRARISFETDVENRYFNRSTHRGEFRLFLLRNGSKIEAEHAINLHFGIASLNVTLPSDTKVGDTLKFQAITTDDTQSEPFKNNFELTVLSDGKKGGGGKGKRRKPPSNEDDKKREAPSGFQLPTIIKVARDADENHRGWEDLTPPFDEYSAVRIIHAGRQEADSTSDEPTKDAYDFYVNIDNFYLKHEQKNRKDDAEVLTAKYIYAQVLLSLGLINYDNQENGQKTDDEMLVEDKVESFSIAVSPVILPIINDLGGLVLEE